MGLPAGAVAAPWSWNKRAASRWLQDASCGGRPMQRRGCDTQKDMYKRIVLKLSGEALAGSRGFGLDAAKVAEITEELADVHALGVEVGVVVGGGNFFRGVAEQAKQMDRVSADNMGMLSTIINAIALQDALEQRGVQCRVMSAVFMNQLAEPYIRRRAVRHLEKGA